LSNAEFTTVGDINPPLPGWRTIDTSSAASSGARLIGNFFEWFGSLAIFFWRVTRVAATPPYEWRELVRQLDDIGSKSFPLVAMAGAAIGVVLSMEGRSSLTQFGAKSLLPSVLVYSVILEMGPIVTGLIVSGRVGAGIGAELAAMKVTEQIDAIEASAVNPYRLLAAPRILACTLMLPLLTLAADFFWLLMGWVAQALVEPISLRQFIDAGFHGANFHSFLPPTFKTAAFGLIIGFIACFQGMRTRGGAEGVGRAATSSVVTASLFVMLADVVLVKLILIFFP
jgi:phospholipid/cholesterol/gamma-HCH transport system permease protein